jgi:hypothetical protein
MRSALQKSLFLLLLAIPASAQNCALCYTQAAANSKLKSALKSGILILMFPPMMISTGLIVTAYKRRNRFHQEDVETKNNSALGW